VNISICEKEITSTTTIILLLLLITIIITTKIILIIIIFLLQILKEKDKLHMPVSEIRQQLPEVSIPCCESRHFESEGLRRNELTKLKEELKECHWNTQDLPIKFMKGSSCLQSELNEVSKFFHTIYILNFQI
jgi:hypothetical protein